MMLSTSSAEEEETCATEVKISSADEPQEMQEQIYCVTTKTAPCLRLRNTVYVPHRVTEVRPQRPSSSSPMSS